MLITGYHGTKRHLANKIIQEGKYHISKGDKEWLGNGIYFYERFSDAYAWRRGAEEENAVLHSVIEVDDSAYIDIDTEEGKNLWLAILEGIVRNRHIELTGTAEENQCAVCRIIWDIVPEVKVLAASFAAEPSVARLLIDKRPRRREFCVRDNGPIKCTQIIDYRG